MHYSIWDRQCGCVLYSGRNSQNKIEAINSGIDYLTSDWDDAFENVPIEEYQELLNGFGLEIFEHEEKIEEE